MRYWVQSWSGRALDLEHPRVEDIGLEDMSESLSRIARFTGHNRGDSYTVSQHSVLVAERVAELAPRDYPLQLGSLLHDGGEYMIGDVSSPLKALLRAHWTGYGPNPLDEIEHQIQDVIGTWAGLGGGDLLRHPLVKQADLELLATEARDLMAKPPRMWLKMPEPLPYTISPWSRTKARDRFVAEFRRLQKLVREAA